MLLVQATPQARPLQPDLVKTIVTEPMKLRHPLSAFTHSESALSTGPTSRRIQNSDKEEELAPEWKSP
ncbi:unnamed protein product [Vitrella brassicaformis CCMP3155]|uniref:Uncharacterized protein n=1 Tax=Vitrella brassicaformis (strain CCMP3155) TaxID=1169540 RepID=A0A0G4H1V5_VITBC|nr:unnamed protein product [Vitrella brassicaformis CCMP3155]|eukprot:CEM37489.1 unnamed protein product [Vitrella brassicaformis CCMP3155]